MKISLVAAPTATEFENCDELDSESVREAAQKPQLGILNLAAVLEKQLCDLRLVNLNRMFVDHKLRASVHEEEFAQIAAQLIVEQDADVYGFGSICSSYPLTIRIAKEVKFSRPNSTILFGGPQASIVDVPTLLAFPFIDLILRGEAEHTLPLLLEELQGQARFERVPSLSYRLDRAPRRNEAASIIQDLDALPSPAYHLSGELEEASEALLELGRGCPFSCTFCSTNDFFRRKFRLRSPERVLSDMRAINAQYGISHFDLVHDMFTVDRRRVVEFCNAMASSNTGFTWACSARTDCIDEELMELMYQAGCRGMFFGVEVGSERMQKIIDKHLDVQRARQIVDYAERLGIADTVSLITGFPEETWEDLQQTIKMFVHSAHCVQSNPQLNLLAPLAGTPIYERHKNELILEELCSDVSHQGRTQHPLDRGLIQEYPEIFPNFYLLPTKHLDRSLLIELREFCLAMKSRFRWLLVAIDQNSDGALNIYTEWRQHRFHIHPNLNGSELRQYYRTALFKSDFIQFLGQHPLKDAPSVAALLHYEKAVLSPVAAARTYDGEPLKLGETLWWNDVPSRKGRTRTLELSVDIQQVIELLKVGGEREWMHGRYFYVLREVSRGTDRLEQISDWMAAVLRACDGTRDIQSVSDQLGSDIPEIDSASRSYVCVRLLQEARAQGLINIYRCAKFVPSSVKWPKFSVGPRLPASR